MYWLFIILLFNAIVPTKRFPIMGVPAGEFITLIIYLAFAARVVLFDRTKHFRSSLGKVWIACLIVVAISASCGFFVDSDHTPWLWNMKQVIHYLFIFPLVATVKTWEQYKACLRAYVIVGVLAAGLLHLYELFPSLVDWDTGTGFIHSSVGGYARIFTPGMQYVALVAIGLLPFLRRYPAALAGWLFLLSGLVWTFGRTYFLILGICMVLYVSMSITSEVFGKTLRRMVAVGILLWLGVLAMEAGFFQRGAVPALLARMGTLTEVGSGPLSEFDTLGWRIRDAGNAILEVETPLEMTVGVFAKWYGTEGTEGVSVHLGWVGLYYHYGLLGVAVFGVLVFLISKKALSLFRAARKSAHSVESEWVASLCLGWVALCLLTFGGGTFVSGPGIIALALLWYGMLLAATQFRTMDNEAAIRWHRDVHARSIVAL
jgi:hypothetical protein